MGDVPGLKLIQAVDPTKIKVTINNKFSKLTLSSNKKKKQAAGNLKTPIDPVKLEKRRSASRNLMDELDDDVSEEMSANNHKLNANAILRSSSLSGEDTETNTLTQIFDVKVEDRSLVAESMERLQLSEDFSKERRSFDEENELNDLTQKVSGISVRLEQKKKEHRKNNRLSPEIIDIDSSSENESSDGDEESAISVSDSSTGSIVQDPYNGYNFMVISDVRSTAETSAQQLPCTLSNDRVDRIEAFLHDVSQEQRNMEATGRLPDDSLLVHLDLAIENGWKKDETLLEKVKAKVIATADTESMSPTNTEFNPNNEQSEKYLNFSKKLNMAFDDTEIMSESARTSLFPSEEHSERKLNNQMEDENAKRLVNDDTEVNTTINSFEKSYQSDVQIIEDSVIISETSSDDIDSSHHTSTENNELIPSREALSTSQKSGSEQHSQIGFNVESISISAKINIKLQIQTQLSSSTEGSDEKDESYGSDRSDGNKSDSTNEKSSIDKAELVESKGKSTNSHNSVQKDVKSDQVQNNDHLQLPVKQIQKSKASTNIIPKVPPSNPDVATLSATDVHFMSHAQKLLTELYGNSWQTPDVIRTLRRTNDEAKRKTRLTFKNIEKNNKVTTRPEINIIEHEKQVEESVLDDFSMFRENIVQTNLNSTRMTTPKVKIIRKLSSKCSTEPKPPPKKCSANKLPTPQAALKNKSARTQKERQTNDRWRMLVDSDSDSDNNNITDDADVDQTVLTDDNDEDISNASDSSWRNSVQEVSSEEEDFEIRKKNTKKSVNKTRSRDNKKNASKDRLIYMDLSKDEVSILEGTPNISPPANKDANFERRLLQVLSGCRYEDKPKLPATPTSTGKSKRRLFTVSYSDEVKDESITAICRGETPKRKDADLEDDENLENVRFVGEAIPRSFNIFNKPLEAIKAGKPVFKITHSNAKVPGTPIATREENTPFRNKNQNFNRTPTTNKQKLDEISTTPSFKYSFLKSLDVCVGKSLCHPDALVFRENYRQRKEDLAKILYELYNSKLFGNNLNVPIVWNKKLLNTAGRCLNKKKLGQRLSVIELSDKVLTSADRLRCTLIHELCHAATWIFDGEGGHGAKWKEWARKANAVFLDLPKIGVCHQYDIEYKYTYKCTLCAAKSYYHSKSKKVENIRCSYCYGAIEVFLNKKDKEGNIIPTPVKEPTGFAKFVKEKYQQYKRPDMKHAEIMKILSNEFAALKVAGTAK